jgi:hypothetical protein
MVVANATQGERELARAVSIQNWTANMTYDTPLSLMNQETDYPKASDLFQDLPWYQTYPSNVIDSSPLECCFRSSVQPTTDQEAVLSHTLPADSEETILQRYTGNNFASFQLWIMLP